MRFNTQLLAFSCALCIAHIQAGPVRWAAHFVRQADTSEPLPTPPLSSTTREEGISSVSTPRPIFRTLTSSTPSESEPIPTHADKAVDSEDLTVPLTDSGKLTAIEPLPELNTAPGLGLTTENGGSDQTASGTTATPTQEETEPTVAATLSVNTSGNLDQSVSTTESLPRGSTGAITTTSLADSSTQLVSTQSTSTSEAASTNTSTGSNIPTSGASSELNPSPSTTSQTDHLGLSTTSIPEDTQPATLPSSDTTSTLSTPVDSTTSSTSQTTDDVSSQTTSIPSVSQTLATSTLSLSSLSETLTSLPSLATTTGTSEPTTTVFHTSKLTKTVTLHRSESTSNQHSTVSTGLLTGTTTSPSGIYTSNIAEAMQQNKAFATLTPQSPCTGTQKACINHKSAKCDNGVFVINACPDIQECFAMPLNDTRGTTVECVDAAYAEVILGTIDFGSGSEDGSTTSSNPPTTFSTETKKPIITRTHYVTVTADISAPTSQESAPPSQPLPQPDSATSTVHSDFSSTSISSITSKSSPMSTSSPTSTPSPPLPPSSSSDSLPSDGLVVITQSFPTVSQTVPPVPPQGNPSSLVLIVLPDEQSSSGPEATYNSVIGDGATNPTSAIQTQIGTPTVSYITVTVTEKEKETVTVTVHG